jgi:DNA invertase Pin-like site-specific DNA recombinase
MFIGYARVSTADQTLDLQKDALEKAGCTKIFTDTASGAKAERTGLDEVLNYVRSGDTLVVWRLDRLGRSLTHLIATIIGLSDQHIGFKSVTENIDTTSSGGSSSISSARWPRRRHPRAPIEKVAISWWRKSGENLIALLLLQFLL